MCFLYHAGEVQVGLLGVVLSITCPVVTKVHLVPWNRLDAQYGSARALALYARVGARYNRKAKIRARGDAAGNAVEALLLGPRQLIHRPL